MKRYYAGVDDEYFDEGPFDTKTEAVAALNGQAGYIAYAEKPEIALADFVDTELLLEYAEEAAWEYSGDDILFDISTIQRKALDLAIKKAIDKWQVDNKIVFNSYTFGDDTEIEQVDEDGNTVSIWPENEKR